MFGRTGGFGTQSTNFGFGGTATNTFGQSNQLFGSAPSGFNNTTPIFGSTAQPMFGNTASSAAPLFGTSNASTFGQPTQSGFGSSLFGSSTNTSSNSGIFGSSSSSTFGSQTKPAGFGFSSNTGTNLFSQNMGQGQQTGPSVFQSNATTNLFGNSGTFGSNTNQMGTVLKFVAVTGTDSVQKSGIVQSINTKHHCITCMKEYEGKSLEELRYEDYQCNRKGPMQQPAFGQPQPFGISSTSSSMFGQPDKPAFGTQRGDFGTPSFGMGTQTTTQNIFGKPTTGFGTTTSTSGFPFSTNTSTGLFGTNNQPKPFAAPSNNLFASSQPQQSTFGNVFNQGNQQNAGGIFGKPPNAGFNTSQSGAFTFGNAQQNQSSLFQPSKPNTGFAIFGQNNAQAPAFGQQQQQMSSFGLNSNFRKPGQPLFGQPAQPAFGTQSIFGNNQNKPLFGNNTGTSLFGNSFQQNTPFQMNAQPQPQGPNLGQVDNQQAQELRYLVNCADPYGYNKHLEGLSPLKPTSPAYVTNPKDIQKLLETPPPITAVTVSNKRLPMLPITAKKNLFDDVHDKEVAEINLALRTSSKRLILTHQPKNKEKTDDNQEKKNDELSLQATQPEKSNVTDSNNGSVLDITPVEKYKEQGREGEVIQDSISSLMNINTNLMKGVINREAVAAEPTPISSHIIRVNARSEEQKESEKSKQVDTCGVKLTRMEYYTVPPLEKLIDHKQADGRCLVQGFTIGRVGYGNISFPDLMDISNLDLDELVHFRYREVTVYPDDTKKPPEGQGLNRKAQVTLDKVFPKSKMDRKLITDMETLIAMNFADTLRDLCEKHRTKFLDYRPETGSWVFMVDHFSKYAFTDPDENDPPAEPSKKKTPDPNRKLTEEEKQLKKKELQLITIKRTEKMCDSDSTTGLLGEEDLFDISMEMEDSLGPNGASIENIDFDYSSLPDPRDMRVPIEAHGSLFSLPTHDIYFMKASLYESDRFRHLHGDEDIEIVDVSSEELFFSPIDSFEPEDKGETKTREVVKPKTFKLQETVVIPILGDRKSCERNYVDMVVFKGASFKVGWARGSVLTTQVFAEPQLSDSEDQWSGLLQLIEIAGTPDFNPFLHNLEKHLEVVLEYSDINMENGNIPWFSVRAGKGALLRHQILAKETSMQNDDNYPEVTYYQQVWDLCVAFWGPMTKPTNRSDLFDTWLQEVVKDDVSTEYAEVEEKTPEQTFLKIFIQLTGHNITEATRIAEMAGLYNLATCISAINNSDFTKNKMCQQLGYWRNCSLLQRLDYHLVKIFMLTGGINTFAVPELKRNIKLFRGLDWKRCLAMTFWYMVAKYKCIEKSLDLFIEDYKAGFSARAYAPFSDSEEHYNLLFHLILLFCERGCPLKNVLEPQTHSAFPTDYRLSWLLLHTLQSLGVGKTTSSTQVFLTTSFAEQLESIGMYKWAVFVLLFLKEMPLRKHYIMGVLHRNLEQGEVGKFMEEEMVKELCLPSEWIHQAKAYKCNLLTMDWEAYKHFTYASDFESSHEVAIAHIVPQLIVNEMFDLAAYVLRDIEPGCRGVLSWPDEGGLLLMFLDIHDKFQEKTSFSKEEGFGISSLLSRVSTGIHKFPNKNALQMAAISAISTYCNLYERVLSGQLEQIGTYSFEVELFCTPPDHKIDCVKVAATPATSPSIVHPTEPAPELTDTSDDQFEDCYPAD